MANNMAEITTIKRMGKSSMGVLFDKGVLEHIYNAQVGDKVEVDYQPPDKILLTFIKDEKTKE